MKLYQREKKKGKKDKNIDVYGRIAELITDAIVASLQSPHHRHIGTRTAN